MTVQEITTNSGIEITLDEDGFLNISYDINWDREESINFGPRDIGELRDFLNQLPLTNPLTKEK